MTQGVGPETEAQAGAVQGACSRTLRGATNWTPIIGSPEDRRILAAPDIFWETAGCTGKGGLVVWHSASPAQARSMIFGIMPDPTQV